MSGRKSQRKGDSFELEAKRAFQAANITCLKTGMYQEHDLIVLMGGTERIVECKRRKRGFAVL